MNDITKAAPAADTARREPPAVLIATSATEAFSAWLREHPVEGVTLVDSGATALQWIGCSLPDLVFLDFRPLRDAWSGLRLARALRRSLGVRPIIRVMADSQDGQLHDLVVQAGGDGLIRRSPRCVLKAVTGQGAAAPAPSASSTQRVSQVHERIVERFRAQAGPLASLHIAEAVEGVDDDELLVERLASKLVLPRARAEFLASIR